MKGMAGEPLSLPPYGYMKDPDNPKRWIIDEEAALIVKNIYNMALDGYGVEQIATALERNNVLTPLQYWNSKGLNRGGIKADMKYSWGSTTVGKILSLQEYCGDIINFKTYSKSFKNKKRLVNAEENLAIFKDVHEPIIDRTTWEKVQEKRGKVRKKVNSSGEKNMFSGLLVCADCGGNMNFHFNQGNHEIKYFNCANNNRARKTCSATHYIRVDFLEQVVLQEVRRLTKFASRYENEFTELIVGHSKHVSEIERKIKEKELNKLIARDKELDRLFECTYEDNASGKLSDERYMKITKSYELEQGELLDKIKGLRTELEKSTNKSMTADAFIKIVRKYTKAKKLSEIMLNELVERIEVFHAEIIDGVKTQRLIIHYNCVGIIDIPSDLPLPEPEIIINTRQGVWVNYAT